jgi:phage terminase large subunit
LGGRGAKSDHTVIWIAQFVEKEVRVIDYYIARGQTLATHIAWLERKGYETALCYLPHDGAPKSPIADASWATTLEDAGYEVEVVPNQGAGAAMMRIEAARNLFPSIVMDEERTKHGRNWIGKYAPKYDEEKRIDLGPNHNDYSHPADAFGMMCQCFEPPMTVEEVVIDDAWVV